MNQQPHNAQVAFAQAVKNLKENMPAHLEWEALNAQILRHKYLKLIEAGFSEFQALEICKKP